MKPVSFQLQLSDCTGSLHPMAVEGFLLFNAGKYWEAHESLEEAWRDESGPVRYLYQGVLQVGVTYLHILRRNYAGAVKVYRRSQRLLAPFPAFCRGVDVGRLREDAKRVMVEVDRLGEKGLDAFDKALLKPVVWVEND